MKKNGFTLVEVLVSLILVSIVMASMFATLIKVRTTYSIINSDSDIEIATASLSRIVNNDINKNGGIKYIDCDTTGTVCNFTLANSQKRRLKIYSVNIYENENKYCPGATDLSSCLETDIKKEISISNNTNTIKYSDTTKVPETEPNNDGNILYIKTLNVVINTNTCGCTSLCNCKNSAEITTTGKTFRSIHVENITFPNVNNDDYNNALTSITISINNTHDVNDYTNNVVLYSSSNYLKESLKYGDEINFMLDNHLDGATVIEKTKNIVVKFGIGFYVIDESSDEYMIKVNNLHSYIPTSEGHTFSGYYYVYDGSEIQVIDENGDFKVSNKYFSDRSITTLYAKWDYVESPPTPPYPTSTLTMDANGGNISQTSIQFTNGTQYGTLPTPTRSGYDFVGWFTDPIGGTQITSSNLGLGNATIYAQWINETNHIHTTLNIDKTGYINILSDSFTGISDAIVIIDGVKQTSYSKKYSFSTTGKHSVDIYPTSLNSMVDMFNGCNYVTSVSFYNLQTQNKIWNLDRMFQGCTRLRYVDLSEFNKFTIGPKSMNSMFKNCSSIESIDVSMIKSSQLISLESTFEGCSNLTALKMMANSSAEIASMNNMIKGANKLCHIDLSKLTLGSSTDFTGFPGDCDNKNIIFRDDIDFMVLMSLGCGMTSGSGSAIYNNSSRSCESQGNLTYEMSSVNSCPAYTNNISGVCIRTEGWYEQFEPN